MCKMIQRMSFRYNRETRAEGLGSAPSNIKAAGEEQLRK